MDTLQQRPPLIVGALRVSHLLVMCPVFSSLLQPFFDPHFYFSLSGLAKDEELRQGDTIFIPFPSGQVYQILTLTSLQNIFLAFHFHLLASECICSEALHTALYESSESIYQLQPRFRPSQKACL